MNPQTTPPEWAKNGLAVTTIDGITGKLLYFSLYEPSWVFETTLRRCCPIADWSLLKPAAIKQPEKPDAWPNGDDLFDWDSAPAWASWGAIDQNCIANWFLDKPDCLPAKGYWLGDPRYKAIDVPYQEGIEAHHVSIPRGLDWKTSLRERPKPAAAPERTQDDVDNQELTNLWAVEHDRIKGCDIRVNMTYMSAFHKGALVMRKHERDAIREDVTLLTRFYPINESDEQRSRKAAAWTRLRKRLGIEVGS